jgi:putative FmdB family regulatory protein
MPIYEFACPKCRRIYSFLSKRVNPDRSPVCPKCGNKKLQKELSRFALMRGAKVPSAGPDGGADLPNLDDPNFERAMLEMERDMEHLDDKNPKHMAHLMRKMKDLMPPGSVPKDFDKAIKRLESGEDPEKVEADMGELFGDLSGGSGGAGSYAKDSGLYDY